MKKIHCYLVAFFCLILQSLQICAQHNISELAGRWESADGQTGNVQFLEGSKVLISVNGIQVPEAAYTVDFSRNPIWFDVTVAPSKTVKGLLEFEADDTVKWQIFLTGDRAYDFTESEANPIIILKRKK